MREHENKTSARQLQHEDFELVAETIIKLCAAKELRRADMPATWASTRDIAEDCDFSIYKTRYLLLKMAKKGWVQVTPQPINNALRWYICPDIKTVNQDSQ
ncbi:MAG: FaeA/PapI family transcriptional regulator [Serratia inhibens]|uniref:FaeA/PapI family transcriptional regulator n=1 Tax=Serratia inhibens TaxID=2338073 RepID=UPI003C7BC8B9